MNDSKTIRLSNDLHKILKLAAVEAELSMQEFLKRVLTSHNSRRGDNENLPDCPLCRKYGNVPNEETRKALEASIRGKGLSKPFKSTKELFDHLDKE